MAFSEAVSNNNSNCNCSNNRAVEVYSAVEGDVILAVVVAFSEAIPVRNNNSNYKPVEA